ncbi:phospholipase A1-Igamma2, chloroplastic-like [Cryptomeria japonica]|uniref:phospholipase A1-Igamma2, chloroplastic-like n=1 Tax=Cryptomeria japonica TaxID=3369 RepID=UPI0027DA94C4|nr:phospholipase A1-Igamma2, chloroplastic-like [Cryptomeria japonica]
MAISRLVLGNWKEANDKTNGDAEDKPNQLKVCDMWRDIQGDNHWNGLLDPINPLLKAEVLRYGDFAQQCYDSFDNTPSSTYYGNCKRSKSSLGQRLDFLNCGRGYQVTKYIYANTSLLDSIFGEESSEGVAWIGYIAVCTDPNEIKRLGRRDIVVGWRGTQTPFEWMQNLRDILVPVMTSKATTCSNIQTISNPDARIEKGFLSCYTATDEDSVRCMLSARDTVVGEITRLVKEYKEKEEDLSITFTGHSLGAALATLSAYDIKQIMLNEYGVTSIPVTVFAFASPRVGNLSFAQHMEEIGVKVLRVVNHKDLVPKVPGIFFNENLGWLTRLLHWLPWAYVHVGVEISLDSSSSAFLKHMHNPANFHNLEVYLHALDGFQGNNKLPFKPSGRDPALVNKHSDLLIESLQIPSNWWEKRNKEVVKRIDGMLVYSPTTPTPVPLPQIPL